jgi:hypothetical protein
MGAHKRPLREAAIKKTEGYLAPQPILDKMQESSPSKNNPIR